MTPPDNASRGHFQQLLNTALRILRVVRNEERQLRLKDMRCEVEDDRLRWLFDVRMRVFDSVVALNDAEDDYRRSNIGGVEALAATKAACDQARAAISKMKTADEANEALGRMVQIINTLASVVARE